MPTTITGRNLVFILLGIVVAVVGAFVGLTWFNMEKIRTSVAVRRSEKPILKTATGEMVIVPEGEFQVETGQAAPALRTFYIDRNAVPDSLYEQFAKAKGFPVKPAAAASENESQAFCAWAGKRLPTTDELSKAARGARPDQDVSIYGVLNMACGRGFRCAKTQP